MFFDNKVFRDLDRTLRVGVLAFFKIQKDRGGLAIPAVFDRDRPCRELLPRPLEPISPECF